MTHIMVDLETWGTTPGCDLRSIGAVVFDPVAGTLGHQFYINVSGGGAYGLTRDHETEKWWNDQSELARDRLDQGIVFIRDGLVAFGDWWSFFGGDQATFWAHGPHFDEAILGAAFRAARIKVPWGHRAPRDTRTIWEAAGGVGEPEGTFIEHYALDDARYQALKVIEAYRKLREPSDDQIKHMVTRFLGWKLPNDFHPDDGISFDPIASRGTRHEMTREPVGTNLFTYTQAEAMVRHMVDGLPAPKESSNG